MARTGEFFRDAHAPAATGFATAAFAAVRDAAGRVLLVQRRDDRNWELPGGRLDVGETLAEAAARETAEEAGIKITVTGVAGVYSDPGHVLVYPEEVRQQVAVVFHAVPDDETDPMVRPDHVETRQAAWVERGRLAALAMHPAVRRRVQDAVDRPSTPAFE